MSEQVATPAPDASGVFGEYGPAVTCAAGVILVLAIAVIDQLTGYDFHLGVLYLVPIAMVTWASGGKWGLAIGAVATVVWIVIFRSEHHYPNSFYFYWDAAVQFIIFAIVIFLLARLREAIRGHELSLSILEKLDAAAYVIDLQRQEILLGNREFRAAFEGRTAEELASRPAKEARFALADGRPALLRILKS
ncbi:MAG TPA: hypothetical protein VEU32_03210 [Burkholderiales bacterium]|nr:hypothetical protein [Burkholderiales bacterium]